MKRRLLHTLIALAAFSAGFAVWSKAGRRPPTDPTDLRLLDVKSFGKDNGRGNLVGIQPYMLASDYASEERFRRKIDGYFAEARQRRLLGAKTIVVLPEYLGTWLVAAGEKRSVYRAGSIDRAMKLMVASDLVAFLRQDPWRGGARRALFRMKGPQMAATYQRVCSGLAATYQVTVVAGSIALPEAEIPGGSCKRQPGRIMNVSPVYGADGRLLGVAEKAFLTSEEQGFLDAGSVGRGTQGFDTPAGRLGVLVCADAWYPECYRRMKDAKVEIVAVPSFLSTGAENAWEQTWFGYQGRAPDDVDRRDVQHLTEGEAYLKYSLPGRIGESGARAGIGVFLRGRLWDLTSDGSAHAVVDGKAHEAPRGTGATILNQWL